MIAVLWMDYHQHLLLVVEIEVTIKIEKVRFVEVDEVE